MILFGQDQQCRTLRAGEPTTTPILRSYLIQQQPPRTRTAAPRTDLRAVNQLTITNHNCKMPTMDPWNSLKPGNYAGHGPLLPPHLWHNNPHGLHELRTSTGAAPTANCTVTWNMLTAMGKNLQPQRRHVHSGRRYSLSTSSTTSSKICHRQMKSEHTQKVRLHL